MPQPPISASALPGAGDAMARLLAEPQPGDNAPALSVSELSARLKRHVEQGFGHVRVRGEISGFKRAASGHCYLCLKDDKSTLDGVMWAQGARNLAFRPEDGLEVVATGRLTTYPGRSRYQLIIESMEVAGVGALLALLERVKARLAADGLLDPARKRPLPPLPRVIGVVTSPTGAVIRDMIHRFQERFPVHLVVWPALVQGSDAARQVVAGLEGLASGTLFPRPDLIIVARGGGSIEDLWTFNEEVVARAIAASPIPVISAIGHETDVTLADHVADLRAPTPTAAAELALPVLFDLSDRIDAAAARAGRAVSRDLMRARDRLNATARLLPARDALHQPQAQRLDELAGRAAQALGRRLADGERRLAMQTLRPSLLQGRWRAGRARLDAAMPHPRLVRRPWQSATERLSQMTALLEALHPDAPLNRGYARVESEGGAVVTSVRAAAALPRLRLVMRDGALTLQPADGERARKAPRPAAAQPGLFD